MICEIGRDVPSAGSVNRSPASLAREAGNYVLSVMLVGASHMEIVVVGTTPLSHIEQRMVPRRNRKRLQQNHVPYDVPAQYVVPRTKWVVIENTFFSNLEYPVIVAKVVSSC